jgi:hypothetical protein
MGTREPKRYQSAELEKPMSLSTANHLHHQTYNAEVLDGEEWKPFGKIDVLPHGIFHQESQLQNASFHQPHNAVTFNAHTTQGAGVGRFDFTARGQALVGVMRAADGSTLAVRATKGYDEIFDTQRWLKGQPESTKQAFEKLEIKTHWEDGLGAPTLVAQYFLGDSEVSDRVRVTKVDQKTGQTWLEMVPSFGPIGGSDRFDIVLAFGGKSFSGTYTSDSGEVYNWTGSLQQQQRTKLAQALRAVASQPVPNRAASVSLATRAPTASAVANALVRSSLATSAGTLSVQDLNNVSSITIATNSKGDEITIDQAQTTAGTYFNQCLLNGLEDKWIDDLFGQRYSLNEGVTSIFNQYKGFFQGNSILATGTVLKSSIGGNSPDADAVKKIDQRKLDAHWKALSSNKDSAPTYQAVTSALYTQGYHDGVAGIQPYIADGAEKWGKAYYDFLTDENTLLTWQIQLASQEFDNVKTRMYEWNTKLSVLAPNQTWAKDMLGVAYSALLGVMYTKMRWSDDIKPFLQQVVENALKGNVDIANDLAKQSAEEQRKLLEKLVTSTDIGVGIMDVISDTIVFWQRKNPNLTWRDYFTKGNIVEDVQQALLSEDQPAAAAFKSWAEQAGKQKAMGVLSGVVYAGAAAFLIYTLATQSGQPLTPKQVVEDVNLGLVALAAAFKGVQKILTVGLGAKLLTWAGDQPKGFAAFAKNIATWFSEDGAIAAETTFGKVVTGIFGKNVSEFFSARLGPVLAVFGLVLSAWFLADAIMSGDVANIVFETLNSIVALVSVIAIGLELASFAWAGPVGLVIAAVGLIIAVVQLIYNLVNPPKPPPDPIEDFVSKELAPAGLTS